MTTDTSASDDAVLDTVFASDRDRGGKSAPPAAEQSPAAEGALAPQSDGKQTAESTPAQQPDEVDESQLHPVPRGILKKERERFRSKLDEESRARVSAETEAKLLREQLSSIERLRSQQTATVVQERPAPQVQIPDPVLEPESHTRFILSQMHQQAYHVQLNASEDRARDKYGDDLVDKALNAAKQAGLVQRNYFLSESPRHPWGALVEWFKKEQVRSRIGNDPEAYEKQVEEKLRQKILEELKAGRGPTGQPQTQQTNGTRFPGTLADATATGTQGAHLTDETVINGVFASNRKRK